MANDLDYTNFDFDSIVTQLENRVKLSDSWKDTYESSTGQMLIELLAAIANLVLYYIERRAEESYINTAQNRSSIINLVKLLNYNPKRVTSSIGVLTFYLAAPNAYKVSIPLWTECQTAAGVKFVTSEAAVIIIGQTEVEVAAVQGTLGTLSATGDGTADQEQAISSTVVENSLNVNTLRVTIDGVLWTKVSSFLSSENTSTHYRTINNLDDTVTIKFGNDVRGKAPSVGSAIVITYILSNGVNGNVYSNNSIVTINDTIENFNSDTVTDIGVTNADRSDSTVSRLFLGGDAREDKEEIRTEAPQVFATGDRAVTKNDFVAILENTSGVVDANVWGENEEAEDAGTTADYEMLNKVKICMILQEWELADSIFEAAVSDALYDDSMISIKYEFIDPVVLEVVTAFSTVICSTGASLTDVQSAIETAMAAQFALGTTSTLGTSTRLSNVIAAAEAVSNVEYHTLVLEIYKPLDDTYESAYDFGELLDAIPILPGTVKIYVDDEVHGTDDEAGAFTDESSEYAVTGTIDYTTGEVLVNFVDDVPASSVVSVRYQQDADGDIEVGRNEICQLREVEVTSIAIISD